MGRKQKLRKAKMQKNVEAARKILEGTSNVAVNDDVSSVSPEGYIADSASYLVDTVEDSKIVYDFPKSECYIQSMQLLCGNGRNLFSDIMEKLTVGATEYGCIPSMHKMGSILLRRNIDGKQMRIHLALPWILEGAVRGSQICAYELVSEFYYKAEVRANVFPPKALTIYWFEMYSKYAELENGYINSVKESKDAYTRECIICRKVDTNTLTLRQCSGCSVCCYCSELCQTFHWRQYDHRSECKQIQILTKYHKPYAQEIREAATRGKTHPALEELRHKLGLSRPREEYMDLFCTSTYEGKLINPYEFLIGREDGTVWVGSGEPGEEDDDDVEDGGSFIGPMRPSSDNPPLPPTTRTTINDVMSMKVGAMKTELKSYGICTGTFIEKSEFVDALQKARDDTDRKPKSTVL